MGERDAEIVARLEEAGCKVDADEFWTRLCRLLNWLKSTTGRHPFEAKLVECGVCKKPINIFHAYRCYDCGMRAHKDCLQAHCEESKRYTEAAQKAADSGNDLPEHLIPEVPHTI